jgi:DNA sulfur modification protein DndC
LAVDDVMRCFEVFEGVKRELSQEYTRRSAAPWIIGFSGGKDSTLLLQAVVEMLLELAPSERRRRVYVCSNDTRVENPVVQRYVDKTLARIADGMEGLGLPVQVEQTRPAPYQGFWANVLGRGYGTPSRGFRWCTDRMKILPTSRFIRERVAADGQVILLLGVRRDESAARERSIDKHGAERLNPHSELKGCMVYRPIVDLGTEDLWALLLQRRPPWGGTHRELVTLYRSALGGECPFVVGQDDAPSCGSTSARMGCWTCTVVDKDKSIHAMIDGGMEQLEPLAEFRDWLKAMSADNGNRMDVRRDGSDGVGPLTMEVRREMLRRLLALQAETGFDLIDAREQKEVADIWDSDHTQGVIRDANRLLSVLQWSAEPPSAPLAGGDKPRR